MMPDAVDVAIAKALVTELATANFSQTINPVRSDAEWERPLETVGVQDNELHVDVVPVATGKTAELDSRGGRVVYTVPVDIAVRKRFGPEAQDDDTGRLIEEEKDALKLLVQEIFELLMPARLTSYTEAAWQETRILACPVKRHLREMRQFTGIIRLVFESTP